MIDWFVPKSFHSSPLLKQPYELVVLVVELVELLQLVQSNGVATLRRTACAKAKIMLRMNLIMMV